MYYLKLIINLIKNLSSNLNCQDQQDKQFTMEMEQYDFTEKQGGSKLKCGKYYHFEERQVVQANFYVINLRVMQVG